MAVGVVRLGPLRLFGLYFTVLFVLLLLAVVMLVVAVLLATCRVIGTAPLLLRCLCLLLAVVPNVVVVGVVPVWKGLFKVGRKAACILLRLE